MAAIWERLQDRGGLRHAYFAHLGSWLARRYGAAAPQFLDPETADRAIEDLGAWLRRAARRGGAR